MVPITSVKPKLKALLIGLLAYGLVMLLFGCTATFPIGDRAQYGYVQATVNYLPPIDWNAGPSFIPQPKLLKDK